MCLGTGANEYDQYTPESTDTHLSGISFQYKTYQMPWVLYTIPPSAIQSGKATGKLTDEGERLVKKGLISLFNEP